MTQKKLEYQFDIDVEFTRLMNSKEQYHAIMDIILTKKARKRFKFGGAFIYGLNPSGIARKDSDLSNLVDVDGPSHDLVWKGFENKINPTKMGQSVYKTPQDYFNNNKPDSKKDTIYFVGDAHGKGEFIEVHWNCFVVSNDVFWYDPSYDKGIRNISDQSEVSESPLTLLNNLDGYDSAEDSDYVYVEEDSEDFDSDDSEVEEQVEKYVSFDENKKKQIMTSINKFDKTKKRKLILIEPENRAQQHRCINQSEMFEDIFCQSWVLLFAAAYIEDVTQSYFELDFTKFQNIIVKQWLLCLFKQMKYAEIDYKKALTKARIKNIETGKCELKTIKIINRDLSISCIDELIEHYSD